MNLVLFKHKVFMSIKKVFDQVAADYDNLRRILIPCFDDFYTTAVNVIQKDHNTPLKILDLGAGTGIYSAMVQAVFPHAQLTLLDLSQDMLEKAKSRFSQMGKYPKIIIGDYVGTDLIGGYDVIISALSIHHLSHAEKEHLYHRIYDLLHPDGIFINADQVLGKTPDLEKLYRQNWLDSIRAGGISVADLQAAQKRMEYDRMSPLDMQLSWLETAGFQNVDCWYKNFSFAVFGGYKAK